MKKRRSGAQVKAGLARTDSGYSNGTHHAAFRVQPLTFMIDAAMRKAEKREEFMAQHGKVRILKEGGKDVDKVVDPFDK